MRQTELTANQKATGRRLSVPARTALKNLMSVERAYQDGSIGDAPKLLDAAAVMFEANTDFATICNMVRHTAQAYQLAIEQDRSRKRRGRPPKPRWTAEQDAALLEYYDQGTQESAISDFKAYYKEEIFTMPVKGSSLADQHQLVKNRETVDQRKVRIERFQRSIDEVIRQRLMHLKKLREDDLLIANFEEVL
jgi:hypothetical protein